MALDPQDEPMFKRFTRQLRACLQAALDDNRPPRASAVPVLRDYPFPQRRR